MSEHGHAGGSEGHGDHHYEYFGEPNDSAGPGEPATPGWLTLLGIGLVLSAMLAYLATRPDGKTRAELSGTPSASAAAAPAPSPDARAARPLPSGFRPPGMPPGMPNGMPNGMPTALGAARPNASAAPRVLRPGPFAVSSGTTRGAPAPRPRPPAPAAPE